MPIHSLGIEALGGLNQTPFVGFVQGGYPHSAFHHSKKTDCFYRATLAVDNTKRETDNTKFCRMQREVYRNVHLKYSGFYCYTYRLVFNINKPGQTMGSQYVSLLWLYIWVDIVVKNNKKKNRIVHTMRAKQALLWVLLNYLL